MGEAADRDECEVLIEEEIEYQRLRGYIRVTAEAVELCEQCEGEGSIPVEEDIVSICDACGGRIGVLSTFKRGRGAEMMSTQFHLRAASRPSRSLRDRIKSLAPTLARDHLQALTRVGEKSDLQRKPLRMFSGQSV